MITEPPTLDRGTSAANAEALTLVIEQVETQVRPALLFFKADAVVLPVFHHGELIALGVAVTSCLQNDSGLQNDSPALLDEGTGDITPAVAAEEGSEMVRLSIRCRSRHTKSAAENHVSYIVLCVADS